MSTSIHAGPGTQLSVGADGRWFHRRPRPQARGLCKTLKVGTDTFWGLSGTAWTGITSLLTAGLLAVAVFAAIYAERQWVSARTQIDEGRAADLEARRPYVIVTIEPSEASRHLFDLVVRNIGQRPAKTVTISLDPPPVRAQETAGFEIANIRMLTEPVAMIAPGQEMRAFYDSHIQRNGRDELPTSHKVLLSYQDSSGHKYRETSVIDINALKGTMFVNVMTVHDIAKSLAEIQKTLRDASVLSRQGFLDVEASVERYDRQQERMARERAEQMRAHQEPMNSVLPNNAGADEPDKSE
jgi:hypothetical protein